MGAGNEPAKRRPYVKPKRQSSGKLTASAVTRRQFMKLRVYRWLRWALSRGRIICFAAQPARKRLVIHGERRVTSLGYHNRRETEHVDGRCGACDPESVTLERVPVLAEEFPSVKKGTWKIDTQKKTMITVYKLRPVSRGTTASPTSKDFEFGWQIAKHPEFSHARPAGAGADLEDRNSR